MRRAQPGDRRAPGAAASLPAPAAWSAPCAPTSCTRTPRPGPGGPGCCSSGSPWSSGCRRSTPSSPSRWSAACSRGRRTSRRLVELVHQRSGGVPLHVEELVNAAAQGHLTPSSHYVPETLAEAVQQRFEALSATARDSAVAAAVVRRSFDLDLLAAVAGHHGGGRRRQPRRAGRPALRAGGVPGVVRLPARPHPRRRRGATRRWPRVAPSTPGSRTWRGVGPELGGDAYRSAHHEAAGQHDEAVGGGRRRGATGPAPLSAHQEALDLLHRAVRCLRAGDDRRASTCSPAGPSRPPPPTTTRRRRQDFEAARGPAPRPPATRWRPRRCSPGWSPRGTSWETRCRPASRCSTGASRRSRASTGARRSGSGPHLLAAKAAAYLVADRLDDAVEVAEEPSRPRAPRTSGPGSTPRSPWGRSWCSPAGCDDGWPRLEEATRRARELGLEAEAARGYRMIGSSASTLVEYDRAERWLGEGIEYAARTEQWNHRHYMASHQAHVWWCRGRWDEADRAAQQAAHRGRGRHHHPDHRPARAGLRRAGPRPVRRRRRASWARRAPRARRCGSCSASRPPSGGSPSAPC